MTETMDHQTHSSSSAEDPEVRLGAEVRAWLGRRNVSQRQLAAMLGMNPTALNFRIQGKRSFDVTELLKIASLLDITLAQLMGDELLNEKSPRQIGGGTMFVAASDGISGLGSHDYESCALTS